MPDRAVPYIKFTYLDGAHQLDWLYKRFTKSWEEPYLVRSASTKVGRFFKAH